MAEDSTIEPTGQATPPKWVEIFNRKQFVTALRFLFSGFLYEPTEEDLAGAHIESGDAVNDQIDKLKIFKLVRMISISHQSICVYTC